MKLDGKLPWNVENLCSSVVFSFIVQYHQYCSVILALYCTLYSCTIPQQSPLLRSAWVRRNMDTSMEDNTN